MRPSHKPVGGLPNAARARHAHASGDSTANSSRSTTEYSPSSSRPPSLSLSSSRDSEFGHVDSPITPLRPIGPHAPPPPPIRKDAVTAPHSFLLAPPSTEVFPQGTTGTNETRAASPVPSSSSGGEVKGKFSRLRHAASASNIGRSFGKKGKAAAVDFDVSEARSAAKGSFSDRNASSFARTISQPARAPSPSGFSMSSRDDAMSAKDVGKGSLLGHEASDYGRANSPAWREYDDDEEEVGKKSKAGKIWGQLFSKQSQQGSVWTSNSSTDGASQLSGSGKSSHNGTLRKADRLLGLGEQERLRQDQTSSPEPREGERLRALNKTPQPRADFIPDVLAEYSADWRPPYRQSTSSRPFTPGHQRQQGSRGSSQSNMTSSSVSSSSSQARRLNHNHNISTSSHDSFGTSTTSESRISDQAPVLDHPLVLAGRDLSDDIEAMLRSQRDSVQDLEALLNAHRHITKKRASQLPQRRSRDKASIASHSVPALPGSSSTSPASLHAQALPSPPESLTFLPTHRGGGRIGQSSLSSAVTDWSTSSYSQSTSFSSNITPDIRTTTDRAGNASTRPPFITAKSELRKGSTSSIDMSRLLSEPAPPTNGKLTPDQFQDATEEARSQGSLPAGNGRGTHPREEVDVTAIALPPTSSKGGPATRSAITSDALYTLPAFQRVTSQAVLDPGVGDARDEKLSRKESPAEMSAAPATLPLQARAAQTLASLPPLASLLEACLVASGNNSKAAKNPWYGFQQQQPDLLTSSTPKDQLPTTWAAYMQLYAQGDLDLTDPPRPVSAPVIRKSSMRSGPNPAMDRFGPTIELPSNNGGKTPGTGLDFKFPLPPNRQGVSVAGGTQGTGANFMKMLKGQRKGTGSGDATASGRSTPALSRVGSAAEGEGLEAYLRDGDLLEAVEAAAGGGVGDLKAARPPYETKRQQATMLYLSALGFLDSRGRRGSDPFGRQDSVQQASQAYRNARLISIVEQIAGLLNTAEASIQLISDDEVLLLAHTGQMITSHDDITRTPRPNTEGRSRGGAGALGVNLFDGSDSRRNSVADPANLRDDSLDAHAILSRRGAPVVLPHIQGDWRFSQRDRVSGASSSAAFWGAASILSSDGMPVGTISVYDFLPRREGLSKDEKAQLAEAAKEAGLELERIRRVALGNRLALFDESLLSWSMSDHRETSSHEQAVASTFGKSQGLLVPPGSIDPGALSALPLQPPSPNGSLAQRRGVKAPRSLDVVGVGPASPRSASLHPQMATFQAALRTIASALGMDLAYIAQVGLRRAPTSPEMSESMECTTIARYDAGLTMSAPELALDAPLHLCALAAAKRGLHFQQDPVRVSQLLGQSPPSASSTAGDVFHTAAVVSCGLKDGARGAKNPEGWVLAVASCAPRARMSPEGTVYLLRFASLLAPFLSEAPKSPLPASATAPATRTIGRARGLSSPALPKFRPPMLSEHRSRSISFSRNSPGNTISPPLPPPSGALPSPPPFSPSVGSAGSSIRSGPSPVTSLRRLAPMAPPPLSPPPTEPLPPLPKGGGVHGANVAVSSPLRTYSPLPAQPISLPTAAAAAGGSSSSSPARPSPPTRSISQPRTHQSRAAMNRHKARSSSAHLDGESVETVASSTSRTELAAIQMQNERY
ncbi:hypothetical protein BCV69DRAFT_275139 [Microstroma glucosiphilum]|uniref:GAF domain-containing protein n=1 Tax=Pseudomicrostroma glucosiphilum TaxID=1684307 RepID=A0A316UIA3_9BASI|nr:hypothetical protein BCV69DRAFT_275139 [Pseudomicrostroma glucosiphilum]PWN23663.1 hypothetical protein BCV69DRAFT_275139 [Pseudomicrostroma glucosiphilum]